MVLQAKAWLYKLTMKKVDGNGFNIFLLPYFCWFLQDLVTDDVMLLDSGAEIYIWVGDEASSEEKAKAFQLAKVEWNTVIKQF